MNTFAIDMPELLYFGRGGTPSAQQHKHAFYQIEFCLFGQLFCKAEKKHFALNPGEFWLIPPEVPHQFLDNRNPYEYLSLKFNSNAALSEYHGNDPVSCYWLNSILSIISSEKEISPFSPDGKMIIENYLYGILYHLAVNSADNRPESPFIMTICEEVCKRGYAINVAELANIFQCTRSQLQYRFAKEYNGCTNIKFFIEDILISLANKHLKYSAMNLSEIAKEMNFPSIYIFSRFYKRKTGYSPLRSRRETTP